MMIMMMMMVLLLLVGVMVMWWQKIKIYTASARRHISRVPEASFVPYIY
jgi:uncharacterized membrane protein YsdA (DUF1294 family)